ncbi:MAG: glycosyltransferase family A protein [Lacinutrix sp.]|uniref:glycosyltransferase family 2 protein n=1 Tax=Lacinutrix sp. TaxID=1937692 RepID=UPI00309F46CC
MSNATKTNLKLEILISTINRNSLDFLVKLFPGGSFQSYNLLIINQTTKDCLLESKFANIRVINSFQKGLSNSRNLALQNTIGQFCLIADDDTLYDSNFEETILNSFKNNTEADIITFKMKDFNGNDFKIYSKHSNWHDIKSVQFVNSVVIAFRLDKIIKKNITFNSNFGIGATFETADEYIFLRDCLKVGLKLWFESKYILSHDINSSGKDSGSDSLVFARSALFYKYHGIKGYFKLVHYLILVKKEGLITNKEFLRKFKIGLRGITTYKALSMEGK